MKLKGIIFFLILREFVTGFVITMKEHMYEITQIINPILRLSLILWVLCILECFLNFKCLNVKMKCRLLLTLLIFDVASLLWRIEIP